MIAIFMVVLAAVITSAPAGYMIHTLFSPLARDTAATSEKGVLLVVILASAYTLAYVVVISLGLISAVARFFDIATVY